jgi:hypothetical protein
MTNGFSDATKAGIAVLQRLGKITTEPEMCPWCKIRPASEFDHIEAKSNGGNHTAFNGMFICRVCNITKRAMSIEDWEWLIKHREQISDVKLWLQCKDGAEYHLMFGRKLRKQIGFKLSEPPPIPLHTEVKVRPNPIRSVINPTYVQEWKGGALVIPLW